MRLQPIEKPQGPVLWLVYRITRRQMGRVISPLKVIYARRPQLLPLLDKVVKYQAKPLTISEELKLLIKAYGAQLNQCLFCQDIALAELLRHQLGESKFRQLHRWRDCSDVFSEAEQAVLAFVEEYGTQRQTTDATFAALQRHFTETQIIDIVAINAIEQYFNAMNIPFGIESDGLAERVRYNLGGELTAI
ncbi:MAG: carboxymuconolactone decarboxylase family protein [Hahellaceae bacterium]|nr:carboxymuconolactone decarboxylase family protein [Hahellaceae bacterium]